MGLGNNKLPAAGIGSCGSLKQRYKLLFVVSVLNFPRRKDKTSTTSGSLARIFVPLAIRRLNEKRGSSATASSHNGAI